MVIKPEYSYVLSDEEKDQVKNLEKKIDNALTEGMKRMQPDICITPSNDITRRALEEVQKIYREAGWSVVYVSDQRDGDYLKFSYKSN